MNKRTSFLNMKFDCLTIDQVCDWLSRRTPSSPYAYIVTPNVDHIVRLAKADAEELKPYTQADLCLCDSRVLAKLGRLSGVTLSVVPGSDLSSALFERLVCPDDVVCLVGGREGDADRLEARYPGIVVKQCCPPMGLRNDANARRVAIDAAMAARARFTLLAVGSPQQEMLAFEMGQRQDVRGTALCIGASVDFLLGVQVRAPSIVQRANLEWAWRLATNPRRLARRYLVDGPAIFPMVWRWRRAHRGNSDAEG